VIVELEKQLEDERKKLAELSKSGESLIKEEVTENDIAEIVSKWTGIPVSKLAELRKSGESLIKEEVTENDIAEIVSKWTGIPVSRMLEEEKEKEKILHLEERLAERVVGQREAIEAVANAVRRSRAGLHNPQQPLGSFIFLGPTGVGKTELAKALAEVLFDDENNMVRIDMSEFMEKHAVSRLLGAPPGYVGYEEGGYLTETIVIMTSNLGSQFLKERDHMSEEEISRRMMETLRGFFRPEFLNRVDEIIVFHFLSREDILKIVELQVANINERLKERKLTLELTDAAKNILAERGYDPDFGARPLKRFRKQVSGFVENLSGC